MKLTDIQASGRVLGLDFIRISLAILIYAFHSSIHFSCNYYWLDDFVRLGAIAMTAFFMLSGYSLHLSSSRRDLTKAGEIKQFYIKRLITILPLYYFVALTSVILDLSFGRDTLEQVAVLFPVELFATQSSFTTLFYHSHNGGTWFISCLLICYLVYPFIQSLFQQLSLRSKVISLLLLSAILFYAPFIQHYFHLNSVSVYTSPFYRLIEFIIGVVIAQINTSGLENKFLTIVRKPYSWAISSVLLILGLTMGRRFGLPDDYMLYNIVVVPCFIVIIMSSGSMKFESIKNPAFILYLSKLSFAFFLCQTLPLWAVSRHLCRWAGMESNILRILLSFAVCLVGAVLMHHFVEKPSGAFLKKKFLRQ